MLHVATRVSADGFEVVPDVLTQDHCAVLLEELDALSDGRTAPGTRDLAGKCPAIRALAASGAVRALVEPILGRDARLVRSLYFNKTPQQNWQVGWHQDLTIAVQARSEMGGYGPWSVKEGVVHVQPPVEVLERMLTVRLHLDAADETNGALWVLPGSHRHGRLSSQAVVDLAKGATAAVCAVAASGAMLLRPLLVHSSRKSTAEGQRRVVHLEFAAAHLPAPLAWA